MAGDFSSGKIYDINLIDHTSSEIDTLNGVTSVSFSKDGNYFAAGNNNGNILIYEYDLTEGTFTPHFSFTETGGVISDLVFSPDSRYLVAIDYNLNKLYYIDLSSKSSTVNEVNLSINRPRDIDVTDDGTYYICADDSKVCKLSSITANPTYFTISELTYLRNISILYGGRYLLGVNGSNKVLMIDLFNGESETLINTTASNIDDIVFSDDSLIVYCVGNEIGYLY